MKRPRLMMVFPLFAAVSLRGAEPYFQQNDLPANQSISEFEARWFSKHLREMKEPPLLNHVQDRNLREFRLTILPTWGNPIAVRFQKHQDKYSISARRLDGEGGYDPGKLIESTESSLTVEDSSKLENLLSQLKFFEMQARDNIVGQDGDTWILEGVTNGKYHVIVRWCPSTEATKKRGLEPFLALCEFLIDRSGLSERPKNLNYELLPVRKHSN